jgi:hypothetical protein
MPASPLDNHYVAVDHGAAVEEASFEEVVDEIVFIQWFLILALPDYGKSGPACRPDRTS